MSADDNGRELTGVKLALDTALTICKEYKLRLRTWQRVALAEAALIGILAAVIARLLYG